MAGVGSWWLSVAVLVLAVPRDIVEGKFRRSDIEIEPWAEFPVDFSPLTAQSVLLSKMSWNSSGVFAGDGGGRRQAGLYSDQMLGVVGSHSGAVRASYGPFSVEASLEQPANDSRLLGYDVMARLASHESVYPYSSRVQVLFLLRPKRPGAGRPALPCLRARALFGGAEAVSACRPDSRSLSCLAQIAAPPSWWDGEVPGVRTVPVGYSVHAASAGCPQASLTARPPLVPERSLGAVQFQKRQLALTTIKEDKDVWLHVPKTDVAIGERFRIGVSIHPNFTAPGYVIRAKARRGLRVIAVHPASQDSWDVSHKVKQEGGTTMVTVVRDAPTDAPPTAQSGESADTTVFSVEFEVENTTASSRLVNWRIDYEPEQHVTVVTVVPVRQSAGQSIIPVIWADNVINTAVLNGQQLSVPMSVLTVTQSGQVQNITASAQCESLDPDVLKVRPDCTAVYVDGTETGGALSKKIRVRFAGREVYHELDVWYPELPLEVVLSDPKLSLIRRWKVPAKKRPRRDAQQALDLGAETLGLLGRGDSSQDSGRDRTAKGKCQLRHQQAKVDVYTRFYAPQANTVPRQTGRKQYLYDEDIRHYVTYLTKDQLQVKDPAIVHIEGTRVSGVTAGITQIQVIGQDGEQILGESPIEVSDDKVEVTELHVGLVSGLALETAPLSVEEGGRDRSLTRVTSRRSLFAQYQEALMDARLEFDDGTQVALADVDPRLFSAVVTTLNPDVVAESPGSTARRPAVLAVREGSTTLMLEIALPAECQRRKRNAAVVFDVIPVNVSFADQPRRWWPAEADDEGHRGTEGVEGRIRLSPRPGPVDYGLVRVDYDPDEEMSRLGGGGGGGGGGNGKSDGGGILSIPIDIPFPYPVDYDASVDNEEGQEADGDSGKFAVGEESLSPLEIGMYVVLGIFCVAILAFMINCVLFMARYRHSKKVAHPLASANGAFPQNWVLFGTEFDGRTLPQHRRSGGGCSGGCGGGEEEAIPMRDYRDDSNHSGGGSRGEHTCTESEVSVERHSIEDEEEEEAAAAAGRCVRAREHHRLNQRARTDAAHAPSPPFCHGSCLDLANDPGCCVIAEGGVAGACVPCRCQCQCQCECHRPADKAPERSSSSGNGSVSGSNNSAEEEEEEEEEECTDTERTPLNPPEADPPATPKEAGACCDATPAPAPAATTDAGSDTAGEARTDSELRITVNPADPTSRSSPPQEPPTAAEDCPTHQMDSVC